LLNTTTVKLLGEVDTTLWLNISPDGKLARPAAPHNLLTYEVELGTWDYSNYIQNLDGSDKVLLPKDITLNLATVVQIIK
jgi:hypothetical protein